MRPSRVLIVQWAGDYGEAYHRLNSNGPENYYAQRYSLNECAKLGHRVSQLGVLACTGEAHGAETMPDGVVSICAGGGSSKLEPERVLEQVARFQPTHLIVTTPQIAILKWALRHRVEVLPQFADSFLFSPRGRSFPVEIARKVQHQLYVSRLKSILNDPQIRWVSNHNVNACRQLVDLGVSAHKVVPWDWPAVVHPRQFEPKSLDTRERPWELVFVGAMIPAKGVGDLIDAVGELWQRKERVKLRLIGGGDLEWCRQRILSRGVAHLVELAGPLPHDQVIEAMRQADLVLVPSHHAYPEGLPMTIYEALAVRTPLITSDHPMFRGRIGEDVASVMVPEKAPAAMAAAVRSLMGCPAQYRSMSMAGAEVWERLRCPVTYYELIQRWLAQTQSDDEWLATHSMASGRFPSGSAVR